MKFDTVITEDFEPPSIGVMPVSQETKALHSKPKVATLRRVYSSPKFKAGQKTTFFRKRYYPEVSSVEWNNWQWQLRNRIRDLESLKQIINLNDDEINAIGLSESGLPLNITPYYASLLDRDNPNHPIRRAVVPVTAESILSYGEDEDPLHEESDSPVPGLVHRYPDRVLFLVTDFCSSYCRYCTRSRMVGMSQSPVSDRTRWEKAINYISENKSIRDVLLSGGDPLTLSDESLEWLLSNLRKIEHVEMIRIGTKVPVVLPQRITPSLTRMLKKYHPLWMSIHFTHPEELTPETAQACERLADAGIPLGSQTVLLSGINDNVETIKSLVHGLLKIRVKPYYLYQCDPIPGSGHVRTSVEKGLEIINGLRGHTTGYAIPTYVIDAPGGGGKIPLLPDYITGRDGDDLLLTNYRGGQYRYPDPGGRVGFNGYRFKGGPAMEQVPVL
ncbi:MAG: KamA family radical SAM protein [Deltaproteobacteria bacterium]|nr:KamA family radical SAM protein [Deltaproteobacteria bacterium]